MIIYEVNLHIKPETFDAYYAWLQPHVQQMLNFDGFIHAEILHDQSHPHKLTVVYHIESQKQLDSYLQHHAQKMRDEGMKQFTGQFSASRRIFERLVYYG